MKKAITKERWDRAQAVELTFMLERQESEFKASHQFFFNSILPKIDPFRQQDKILDACCGPVPILKFMPKAALKVAVDSALDKYLEKFPHDADIEYKTMLAENLSFANEHFDKVFCLNAIDHTFDFKRALAELFRVAKKDGTVALTFENMNYMYKFFYGMGFKKLNQIYHPYTISFQDIKNEILKNIDKNAHIQFIPLWEKITFKNIFRQISHDRKGGIKHVSAQYTLPIPSMIVHYFILIWNRLFSFLFKESHAYFVAIVVKKSGHLSAARRKI